LRASEPDPGALFSVVLAAGRGRRIERLAPGVPKPLLPVLDRPLLAWQLAALRSAGAREVALVVGHLGQAICAAVGDGARFGLEVRYVEQEQLLGIAHALLCAAPLLARPFVCLLGDVFFESGDLATLVRAYEPGIDAVLGVRAAQDARELARNYAVELDPEGWVRRVVEKPGDGRIGLKGTGLYVFGPSFAEVLPDTPRSALRGEYELTDAIQLHLERGARVRSAALVGPDFNLSGPEDLLAANLHALALAGLPRWVSPLARVEDGARIERSVVLEHATVRAGARLEETLVLPGEVVPAGSYRSAVFAADTVFSCAGCVPGESGAPGLR